MRHKMEELMRSKSFLTTCCNNIISNAHDYTWMKMKYNIDDILITPCDFQFILFVNWYNIVGPTKCSHACEIHQHDTRVHS